MWHISLDSASSSLSLLLFTPPASLQVWSFMPNSLAIHPNPQISTSTSRNFCLAGQRSEPQHDSQSRSELHMFATALNEVHNVKSKPRKTGASHSLHVAGCLACSSAARARLTTTTQELRLTVARMTHPALELHRRRSLAFSGY
jgi:hypothetical protein